MSGTCCAEGGLHARPRDVPAEEKWQKWGFPYSPRRDLRSLVKFAATRRPRGDVAIVPARPRRDRARASNRRCRCSSSSSAVDVVEAGFGAFGGLKTLPMDVSGIAGGTTQVSDDAAAPFTIRNINPYTDLCQRQRWRAPDASPGRALSTARAAFVPTASWRKIRFNWLGHLLQCQKTKGRAPLCHGESYFRLGPAVQPQAGRRQSSMRVVGFLLGLMRGEGRFLPDPTTIARFGTSGFRSSASVCGFRVMNVRGSMPTAMSRLPHQSCQGKVGRHGHSQFRERRGGGTR